MLLIVGLVIMATGLSSTADEQTGITEVVEAIAAESAAVTTGYYAGPESVAHVVAASLDREPANDELIDLLLNLTESQANVDGTFIGYPDGSFIDVRHDLEPGSDQFLVKTISVTGNGIRDVTVETLDLNLGFVATESLTNDTYDPRIRPWYVGVDQADQNWTQPYVFFASQEPGITYSVPVLDSNSTQVAVVGVDIRLTALQDFLLARQPSANGGAAVVDNNGDLVAGKTQLLETAEGEAAIRALLNNDFATGNTSAVRRLDGEDPWVVTGTPVGAGTDQLLIVDAPDADFLQGLRSSRRGFAVFATLLGIAGILLLGLGAGLIGRYLGALGRLARTDQLTGLLNRAAVYEELAEAIVNDSSVAVMAVDLDDFKLVNDQFGHEGGDEALIRVAQQLQESAPDSAIIGRFGGDEFGIILVDEPEPRRALCSIIEAASGEVQAAQYTFGLNLSAGYTESSSTNSLSAAELFSRADVALYEAKAQPGTTVLAFDDSMHLRWRREDNRKDELKLAIELGQLHLHFQPEIDLQSNAVIGAEGLLRWNKPGHGFATAAEFIGDLERFHMLPRMLPLIFSTARELAATVPSEQDFTIRLNVSAEQLLDPAIIDHLTHAVDTTHVRWCLEVTEGLLVRATSEILAVLERIRELDVELALDDFGTGLSSLSDLPSFPFDTIKIDRLFVDALDSGDVDRFPATSDIEPNTGGHPTMTTVLLQLATVMHVDVVAEGIESEAQRDALVAGGCTRGVGYLFGPALPCAEFVEHWIARYANEASKSRSVA